MRFMYDTTNPSLDDVARRLRRAGQNPPEWSAPSEGTWESIASALDFPPSTTPPPVQPSAGVSRRTLFAGLGGLVLGGAAGALAVGLTQSRDTPDDGAVKRAILTPLDAEDEKLGVAELRPRDVGYSLVVDVPEGADHVGGYIEVWLINVDLERMVSIGVFEAGTSAEFYVSDALIDEGYLIVDLSNEEFDDEPRHSGDTIMRGELRA